jgi:hypothetical protein
MRRLPRHHVTPPWQRQRPRRRLPGVRGNAVHTHDHLDHDNDHLDHDDDHDNHDHEYDDDNNSLPQRYTRLRGADESGLHLRGRLHQSILRPQWGVAGILCTRVRRLDASVRVQCGLLQRLLRQRELPEGEPARALRLRWGLHEPELPGRDLQDELRSRPLHLQRRLQQRVLRLWLLCARCPRRSVRLRWGLHHSVLRQRDVRKLKTCRWAGDGQPGRSCSR